MGYLSKRILAGGLSVLLAFLVTAAILHEASPFYQDAAKNSLLRVIVLLINTPSVFAVTALRSLPFGIIAFVFQWFLIGIFAHWIFFRIQRKHAK
ncbi:MAG: hypothetical protein ACKVQW_00010 [Pyrinomonadaceae bacterium]